MENQLPPWTLFWSPKRIQPRTRSIISPLPRNTSLLVQSQTHPPRRSGTHHLQTGDPKFSTHRLDSPPTSSASTSNASAMGPLTCRSRVRRCVRMASLSAISSINVRTSGGMRRGSRGGGGRSVAGKLVVGGDVLVVACGIIHRPLILLSMVEIMLGFNDIHYVVNHTWSLGGNKSNHRSNNMSVCAKSASQTRQVRMRREKVDPAARVTTLSHHDSNRSYIPRNM